MLCTNRFKCAMVCGGEVEAAEELLRRTAAGVLNTGLDTAARVKDSLAREAVGPWGEDRSATLQP